MLLPQIRERLGKDIALYMYTVDLEREPAMLPGGPEGRYDVSMPRTTTVRDVDALIATVVRPDREP